VPPSFDPPSLPPMVLPHRMTDDISTQSSAHHAAVFVNMPVDKEYRILVKKIYTCLTDTPQGAADLEMHTCCSKCDLVRDLVFSQKGSPHPRQSAFEILRKIRIRPSPVGRIIHDLFRAIHREKNTMPILLVKYSRLVYIATP